MSAAGCWCLKNVRVTDLLGFQKTVEFPFEAGLQVLEAPNHTGKTSLTMALLWGLTGVVPNLVRINKRSFRLTNKHVGENANPSVQITLSHADGRELVIKRAYQPQPDLETDLTIDLDDKTFGGEQAQELLWSELGLKPASLEGCGVVLQDHRLGLITGKDSDVSDVINDMLGLYTLSQLVPTLEASSKEAADLRKEVQAFLNDADPVAKWAERDRQLNDDLRQLENQALQSGLAKELLDDPKAGAFGELAAVAQLLGGESPDPEGEVGQLTEGLRERLKTLRKTHSSAGALAVLQARKAELDQLVDEVRSLAEDLSGHDTRLTGEAAIGEIDPAKLASIVAEKEAQIEQNKLARKKLQEEQGFLTTCYEHLLDHHADNSCPLCMQSMERPQLLSGLKSRIDGSIAIELERLQREQKALTEQKNAQEKRLNSAKTLRSDHDRLMRQVGALEKRAKKAIETWPGPLDIQALYLDSALRKTLLEQIDGIGGSLAAGRSKVEAEITSKQEDCAHREAQQFQPAETRINRVADYLKPIILAAERIEAHGKLRQSAEERRSALGKLLVPEGRELAFDETEQAVAETTSALKQERVTLFEATLRRGHMLARVDILEKSGNEFRIIEVKAKSFDSSEGGNPFRGARGGIQAKWKPYLEDVAFQVMVLGRVFPDATIKPCLCLVDKAGRCSVDMVFKKFKVTPRDANGAGLSAKRPQVVYTGDVEALREDPFVKIIDVRAEVEELLPELRQVAENLVKCIAGDEPKRMPPVLGVDCKKCEYRVEGDQPSGFRECWGELAAPDPHLLDLYRVDCLGTKGLIAEQMIAQKRCGLLDLSPKDLKGKVGERQTIQFNWTRKNGEYLDAKLTQQLAACKYPIHFIDFEASRLAVPYHAGMRPYEQVAFQWSCHSIRGPGADLEHAEWINVEDAYPNFEFARSLRKAIDGAGTVFVWSPFERSALNDIRRQLVQYGQKDKGLADWLNSVAAPTGPLVDLCELAKDYYFHPRMKGSLSIKAVLPAVWFEDAALRAHPWFSQYVRERNGELLGPYEALDPLAFGDGDLRLQWPQRLNNWQRFGRSSRTTAAGC